MAKSRSFSIYLIKKDYSPERALRPEHTLKNSVVADSLPVGSILYILDSAPRSPWWKEYFSIAQELTQVLKGALIFLNVQQRWFALSFGHVAHNLLDTSYEYDFGLRVTLNSLDPTKLKSTDTLDPGAAKRTRTQLPVESELTFFDFDRNSTILKSLTGKVREEYIDFFRHATGSSNLRVSSKVTVNELNILCQRLLNLYENEQYKTTFPEVQNIVPVHDPEQIRFLNNFLLKAFQTEDTTLNLTVPDIINYCDNTFIRFSGAGTGPIYDDLHISHYLDYLKKRQVDLKKIDLDLLHKHHLILTDEDGISRNRYSIFKCLIFDVSINEQVPQSYHFCEGNWYKVDQNYISRLNTYLDDLCTDCDLIPYKHPDEGEYNKDVAQKNNNFICLDRENISSDGQTQVEPCDLLKLVDNKATFYHVKRSTISSQLSHLFNQGTNAIELLRLETSAQKKLEKLIYKNMEKEDAKILISKIKEQNYHVIFSIITPKDPKGKSLNLPLFSRISLMRNMKMLKLMNIPANLMFIEDQSEKKSRKPTRKNNHKS